MKWKIILSRDDAFNTLFSVCFQFFNFFKVYNLNFKVMSLFIWYFIPFFWPKLHYNFNITAYRQLPNRYNLKKIVIRFLKQTGRN